MTKTIRWGIIGVGDVTEVKSGPGFQKANNSALQAVMRRTGALAKDFAQRHGVPSWYDNAEALINDPEVDAVYIATPPDSHLHYTRMVAEAKKPVFVEKPMALSFAQCREMIDTCAAAGVPLWVAYYRRSLPRFLKMKELIDSGVIGEVQSVTIKLYLPPTTATAETDWHHDPKIGGGSGRFVDMGVHTLDYLDYVLGPFKSVHAAASNQSGLNPVEAHVVAHFAFESGVIGVGDWCFTAHAPKDETTIAGSKGEIIFSTFDAAPIILNTEAGTQTLTIDNPLHIHQPLIQTIVDELNGIGTCPSTGHAAARTTWFTEQVFASR